MCEVNKYISSLILVEKIAPNFMVLSPPLPSKISFVKHCESYGSSSIINFPYFFTAFKIFEMVELTDGRHFAFKTFKIWLYKNKAKNQQLYISYSNFLKSN